MTRDDAAEFLTANQPLPPDGEMSRETMETYDKVRRFLSANPDAYCLGPFLGAFGDGDGFGVYQLADKVLEAHAKNDVVDALAEALTSRHRSVRYWNAQLAAEFPSDRLVPFLLVLLGEDDYDMKYAALTALEQCSDETVVPQLELFAAMEAEEELRQLALDVADGLRA